MVSVPINMKFECINKKSHILIAHKGARSQETIEIKRRVRENQDPGLSIRLKDAVHKERQRGIVP